MAKYGYINVFWAGMEKTVVLMKKIMVGHQQIVV